MRRPPHHLLLILLPVLLACAAPVAAQTPPPAGPPQDVSSEGPPPLEGEGTVLVDGEPLLVLGTGIGSFSPVERAAEVSRRLQILAADHDADPTLAAAGPVREGYLITLGSTRIMMVTPEDAAHASTDLEDLAGRWRDTIARRLVRAHEERSRRSLLLGTALTVLYVSALVLLLKLLHAVRTHVFSWIDSQRGRLVRSIRIGSVEIVSDRTLADLLSRTVQLATTAIALVGTYAAVVLSLARFPQTRATGSAMLDFILEPIYRILRGFIGYLPDLITILVIVALTRMALRLMGLIFDKVAAGELSLEPYLHRETAPATRQILRFSIIVFSLFFISPLIPGTGSRAAQGLALLLGLGVSLGSTTMVGNLIAGIALIYMRAFRVGDRVRMGETVGDVLDRTFLRTRILTIKNEEVMVPSLTALSGPIINYSARARTDGLVLHTCVTIGYDAPWRQVRDLLVAAALRTEGVIKEPAPYVLITSLNDFYVTYEINARTDRADQMALIYSDLHAAIQDAFNEAGVEIMSPHYLNLRDGNRTAVPSEHLPAGYEAPRHRVEMKEGSAGGPGGPPAR